MTVLILTNNQGGMYEFRKELLEEMVGKGFYVKVSVPDGDFVYELQSLGVELIPNIYLERRGTNPLKDFKLLCHYRKIIRNIKPDVVLTYTIKPNVYGGIACKKFKIPYISTITGLGTSIENRGILQKLTLSLYKIGLKNSQKVFFQNEYNRSFMMSKNITTLDKSVVLPGSGVNIYEHHYETYPENDDEIVISTIGRIMKDKGTDEILAAAERIRQNHSNVIFRLIGEYDGDYKEKVEKFEKTGAIKHIPFQKDIIPYYKSSHAIIHASYHEGMSNVLLEAASSGRPVIASNVPGCMETFEPDTTGIAFEPKNVDSLVAAIEKFLSLSHDEKEQMGKAGREKMINEFNREIVINKYMNEIAGLINF